MWLKKKKTLKSLIIFHSANKIGNYTGGGGAAKKKKKKIPKKLQNKLKYKNNKCFSWVSAVSILSFAGSHSPPHLPRMPSNTVGPTPCTAGGKVLGPLPQLHCPWVSVVALSPPLHVGHPLGFAPEAGPRGLGSTPIECQVWRWCGFLGHRAPGSTRYSA